jgi:SAM-dependent methyltransferase
MPEDAMFDPGTHGSGPGEISPDGSSVEFYARLPEDRAAAAVIHQAIPAGATVLELGAGTGRVTHPLLALGHPVVAVDVSAGMLARINGARTICARIEDLQLDAEFDAVLLMSYLINYGQREGFLLACQRHVTPAGLRMRTFSACSAAPAFDSTDSSTRNAAGSRPGERSQAALWGR